MEVNCPPSGKWRGFYMQGGNKYKFTLYLEFHSESQAFFGHCQDDDNDYDLDFSDILGHWCLDPIEKIFQVEFDKRYRGEHSVDYRGEFQNVEMSKISGDYFNGADSFIMEFVPEIKDKISVETRQSHMFVNMANLYTNLSFSDHAFFDFSINCTNEKAVKAHKFILASQSKYFEGFFRTEPDKNSVALGFSHENMKKCIDFMYTGEGSEVSEENVEGVLEVANYLGVSSLVNLCSEIMCEGLDIDNCVDVARLSSCVDSPMMIQRSVKFLVDNIQTLIDDLDNPLTRLPIDILRKVLSSDDLVIRTKDGVIIPGIYREFHLLHLLAKYVSVNSGLKLEQFFDCLRIEDKDVIEKFENYSELDNKADIIASLSVSDLMPRLYEPRVMGKEDFFDFDPRFAVVNFSSNSIDEKKIIGRSFNLSCKSFEQQISKMELNTQEIIIPDGGGMSEILKKIHLTFNDGSEQSISTGVGAHNKSYNLDVGVGRHVLYLTGVWVADPLEYLLGLSFVLSDGSQVNLREDNLSLTSSRRQSVLDHLPRKLKAENLSWIGIGGQILDTSNCGDSVIANIKCKFSCLSPSPTKTL